ncbi:MAG: hypothetical protein CUN56_00435 [Phototrophicales bacterium]|nr:MAG: hypothetical protein CUN56_00435 [Phototrophicales bacterium]
MGSELSDLQLVTRAQQGDREAFLTLYNRYLNKVYNRVRSRVPEADVEDVTQEIFLAVVRSLASFRQESKFNTWLYTIVNRQIADYYRRSKKKGNPNPVMSLEAMRAQEPSYEHTTIDDEAALKRALNAVPEHYREIVLMRFADGLSFAEIAEELGKSLEAVKSLYRRAVQAIRDEIGEEEEA